MFVPPSTIQSAEPTAVATQLQLALSQHCIDCHQENAEAEHVRLDRFAQLPKTRQEDLLNKIEEQVSLGRMPPPEERQLTATEKAHLTSLLTRSFAELGITSRFRQRIKAPEYGNYVNHDELFSGTVTAKPFSPPRLWRTSPHLFENIKSRYGADQRHLRQPFVVDDKEGIREYSDLLFADSAVVNVLLANAGTSADQLIKEHPVYKALAESTSAPSLEDLNAAITQHFQRVVYREPSQSELQRYVALFDKSADEADSAEALRVTLMAVMLHHEAVYRIEIGLRPPEPDGRRMLAPAELAFAISYALTDQRPDDALMRAVKRGALHSRDDVRSHVERILRDDSIPKPRILRFFQEFFGYTQAHKVFKDAKRSGGFSYYGENYPEMYERDADFFVMHILEKDRDVFRELLTSDEYFILNRQTFRNTIYDFYQKHREQLEQEKVPAELQQELLSRLNLNGWHELNQKYHLHKFNRGFNGTAAAMKQIVDQVRKWKNTTDEHKLLHGMQPLYKKYPMVYDLKDDEQDFLLPQPYQRPNRAGLLTHPAWLIAHSLNDTTDPIRRGKWIQERLLAGTVPNLPITVDATIPEDHGKTLRERLAVTEQQECWRCHARMNPLGYPFEIYDDFGRYRTAEVLDKLPKVDGEHPRRPIDATSQLSGTGDATLDGEIKDALDLIGRLAESDRVRQSIIRHAFRYWMGRNELLTDSQTLIAADQAYLQSDGSFNELLISLLTSDSFLYRK